MTRNPTPTSAGEAVLTFERATARGVARLRELGPPLPAAGGGTVPPAGPVG